MKLHWNQIVFGISCFLFILFDGVAIGQTQDFEYSYEELTQIMQEGELVDKRFWVQKTFPKLKEFCRTQVTKGQGYVCEKDLKASVFPKDIFDDFMRQTERIELMVYIPRFDPSKNQDPLEFQMYEKIFSSFESEGQKAKNDSGSVLPALMIKSSFYEEDSSFFEYFIGHEYGHFLWSENFSSLRKELLSKERDLEELQMLDPIELESKTIWGKIFARAPEYKEIVRSYFNTIIPDYGDLEERFAWFTTIRYQKFLDPSFSFEEFVCERTRGNEKERKWVAGKIKRKWNPKDCITLGFVWEIRLLKKIWDLALSVE